MNTKRFWSGNFLLSCFLSCYALSIQGLPGNCKILCSKRSIPIEQLAAGNAVTSYDSEIDTFPSVTIQQVSKLDVDSIIEIKTASGSILSASTQLFYDATCNDFVPASSLNNQSILISRNLTKISCTGIVQHDIKTTCYKLALDWPNVFFTSDLEVLVHNADQIIRTIAQPLLAAARAHLPTMSPSLQRLLAVATLSGIAELIRGPSKPIPGKPLEVIKVVPLPSIETMQNHLTRDVATFQDTIARKGATFNPDNFKIHAGRWSIKDPPDILGVKPDPAIYLDICCNPFRYGPICPLAVMLPTGDVLCTLYIMMFSHWEATQPIFVWRKFGDDVLERSNRHIKIFVEFEDRKQLDLLRDFIKTWPEDVSKNLFQPDSHTGLEAEFIKSQFGNLEKIIYGTRFGIHAIRRMVQLSIPPSRIAQAIKNTTCTQAKDPERVIFLDKPSDTTVVVEKESKKIVNIGKASDTPTMDEMPPEDPEDDEDDDDNDEDDDEKIYNDPKSAVTRKSLETQSNKGLEGSKNSFDKQIEKHRTKLAEYRKNPYSCDNRNLLKNAPTTELEKNIIKERVASLKNQIRFFKWKKSITKSILRRRGFKQ